MFAFPAGTTVVQTEEHLARLHTKRQTQLLGDSLIDRGSVRCPLARSRAGGRTGGFKGERDGFKERQRGK